MTIPIQMDIVDMLERFEGFPDMPASDLEIVKSLMNSAAAEIRLLREELEEAEERSTNTSY